MRDSVSQESPPRRARNPKGVETMNEYIIAEVKPPLNGLRFEIVVTIGSDGGPECIAVCYTREDAESIVNALEFRDKMAA